MVPSRCATKRRPRLRVPHINATLSQHPPRRPASSRPRLLLVHAQPVCCPRRFRYSELCLSRRALLSASPFTVLTSFNRDLLQEPRVLRTRTHGRYVHRVLHFLVVQLISSSHQRVLATAQPLDLMSINWTRPRRIHVHGKYIFHAANRTTMTDRYAYRRMY